MEDPDSLRERIGILITYFTGIVSTAIFADVQHNLFPTIVLSQYTFDCACNIRVLVKCDDTNAYHCIIVLTYSVTTYKIVETVASTEVLSKMFP